MEANYSYEFYFIITFLTAFVQLLQKYYNMIAIEQFSELQLGIYLAESAHLRDRLNKSKMRIHKVMRFPYCKN